MSTRLPKSFFRNGAKEVAEKLLGNYFVFHARKNKKFVVRVVETEAYVGAHDLACHASKGKTKRTKVMFEEGGRAYIYFIYGMYEMFNVVTGKKGHPEAVLIRAGECLSHPHLDLSGPGKFTRELGITRNFDGKNLYGRQMYFLKGVYPKKISKGPRIGVGYAGKWAKKHLRFFDADSWAVSRLSD